MAGCPYVRTLRPVWPPFRVRMKILLAEYPEFAERYNIALQGTILIVPRCRPGRATGPLGLDAKWGEVERDGHRRGLDLIGDERLKYL